jgi:hypothetical protein
MRSFVSSSHSAVSGRLSHIPRTGWCFCPANFLNCLRICVQVVAMEMQQCEYRAIIPSALACGGSASFLGRTFNFLSWTFKTVVYLVLFLLVCAAAALLISASTGYGSRFVSILPQVLVFGSLIGSAHLTDFFPVITQLVSQALSKQVY